MKRIVALLLLCVLCVGLCACGNDDPTPDGMQNVADENAKFNLYVPLTWAKNTQGGISGAYFSSLDRSNVTVTAYYPEAPMTVSDYWEKVCLPAYQGGALENFSLLTDLCGATTLGGLNAEKYTFYYTLGESTYQVMQVITSYKGEFYALTYTATSENYQAHLEDLEKILKEFSFR